MNDTGRTWDGVDKTVVEKFATEAGHPPRPPYINTDQGDLLLFLFLLAGAVGGFVAGYAFRALFGPFVAFRSAKAAARATFAERKATDNPPLPPGAGT
jgi:hypothetical protein